MISTSLAASVTGSNSVSVSVGVPNTPSPQLEQEEAWSDGIHSALKEAGGHWAVVPLDVKYPGGVTVIHHACTHSNQQEAAASSSSSSRRRRRKREGKRQHATHDAAGKHCLCKAISRSKCMLAVLPL